MQRHWATIRISTGLHAQAIEGACRKSTGPVVDSSGAAVTGADQSVVTNRATTLTVLSRERCDYDIELLPICTYTVAITMSGFRKEVKAETIPVTAPQTVTVDFKLQVGATIQP